eukprot:TRINITY_DN10721_c0_g1_i1.p1 TRINITY_DN10721_c0_g1~~TRINITY_DN10721_c0_g1_i1.p1  ORF type:complete len:285 (-),score=128.06 TRINITY_DN10721_c0_g1_i1:123-977(-)
MDSIKKKMQSLAKETSGAVSRFEKWEKEVTSTNATADHLEDQVKAVQKRIQQTESAFDVATEDLFNQTIKLEEMEKKAGNAEGQVGDLARRLLLMEEQAIRSEERLAISVTNLANTSIMADKSLADQNELMNICSKKSENNDDLEKQLKDAIFTKTDSETKYETLAQKLKIKESESERSNARADEIECKFIDIEDELKEVGQKQQNLEVGEEMSHKREEVLQKQIKELMTKLTYANEQSENSEMDISRLNVRIDRVEEDLVIEKMKIKQVSDDLNKCFDDMLYI